MLCLEGRGMQQMFQGIDARFIGLHKSSVFLVRKKDGFRTTAAGQHIRDVLLDHLIEDNTESPLELCDADYLVHTLLPILVCIIL